MGNGKRQEVASVIWRGAQGITSSGLLSDQLGRVFMNGHSQAVRILAEFRLATDRVQISRTSEGDLLIHPCPRQRP